MCDMGYGKLIIYTYKCSDFEGFKCTHSLPPSHSLTTSHPHSLPPALTPSPHPHPPFPPSLPASGAPSFPPSLTLPPSLPPSLLPKLVGSALHPPPVSQDILFIKRANHLWLFRQCDVICQHGGIGTTATALRCGKPTIITPFFGDQFLWAEAVEEKVYVPGSPGGRADGSRGGSSIACDAAIQRPGGSLRDEIFFFLLRTALKDRPKGPPTANRQLPSTTNRHQPPTTNRQPPTATNRQRRPTANCQPLPAASNHQPPATNRRQPPPTATNRQLPTANRQPPPTANRQLPPTMVEHMECPRAFLGKLVPEHFFFPVKDTPANARMCGCTRFALACAKKRVPGAVRWSPCSSPRPRFRCAPSQRISILKRRVPVLFMVQTAPSAPSTRRRRRRAAEHATDRVPPSKPPTGQRRGNVRVFRIVLMSTRSVPQVR